MIDFDMMLVHVGEFGIYQKILFLFQAPFAMFVTFVLFGQLFFFLYPRVYWCSEGPCIDGRMLTPEQRRNLTVPWSIQAGQFDPCNTYNVRPQEVANLVNRVQSSCSEVVGFGSNKRGQHQHCDYEMARDSAILTRRLPRQYGYRQYGQLGGSDGGDGDDNYLSTTTKKDDYYYNTEPPTNKPEVYGPTPKPNPKAKNENPGTQDRKEDRKMTPSTQRPANPSPKSGSADTQRQSSFGNVSCPGRIIQLSLHPNFSINAESIANSTRDLRRSQGKNKNGRDIPATGWATVRTCTNWSWDMMDPPYETLVTEERWWCDPESRITIATAIFYLGAIVGGIGIGFIADSRGRVPALVTANVLGCVGGALSAVFYTNFYVFCFLRFITGMAFDNCFTMIYILVLEYVGPTYRTLVANLSIAVFYTIGTLILPGLALLLGNWRIYALAISLPMSLALAAIFIVPESARWLLSKGRTKEATRILRSFAKVNRKHVDESIFVEFEEGAQKMYDEFSQEEAEPSLLQAFKRPRIARNFLFLTVIWALIALVYDGHSRNILNIGNNVFVSFAIASSTEFPADMLLIFTLDRFGRRWLAFGSMCFSGAFSLVSAFIPTGMMTVSLVTALISRFFVNVAFNIGLQYAAELLPTVIRAQGVNVIHIMGYVASIISPFIASIGRTNPALSLSLLGILACICGFLCLFLPETLGEELPNSLDEGEAFGKNQSFWNCPICAKPKLEEEEPIEIMAPTPVQLRNNMRASLRGETFRSSIISTSSSRRVTPTDHLLMNPSGSLGPSSKLRRVYTH